MWSFSGGPKGEISQYSRKEFALRQLHDHFTTLYNCILKISKTKEGETPNIDTFTSHWLFIFSFVVPLNKHSLN